MRIKYNILWVDDRKDTFEKAGYDKRIRDYVKGLFLEPQLTLCESVDEAKEILQTSTFDVIFSDFNINDSDGDEQGNDFVEYVRGQNVNTEILFYSAMAELPPMHVNRISFFSFAGQKGAYQELLAQMELLINLTVEKLNDITALRGLVMAEVSELDVLMEQIIAQYYTTSERMKIFHEHITANRETTLHNMLNPGNKCDKQCLHVWREKDLSEYISKLDSSQKAHAINLVLEQIDDDHKISTDKHFFKSYNDTVIFNRNNLAHCRSVIDENGNEILQTWKGDIRYNDGDIKSMRANIIKYHQMFTTILEILR